VALGSSSVAAGVGVTRDLSVSGLSLGTANRYRVGDQLQIELQLGPDPGECVCARARVMRFSVNREADIGLWRNEVALQFYRPLRRGLLRRLAQPSPE